MGISFEVSEDVVTSCNNQYPVNMNDHTQLILYGKTMKVHILIMICHTPYYDISKLSKWTHTPQNEPFTGIALSRK